MISLLTYEPASVSHVEDETLSVLLDHIDPCGWMFNRLPCGSVEPWVTLRKAMPGWPAGIRVRLRDLHERITEGWAQ